MRIRNTDTREREWDQLKKATGENTVAGAIDTAVRYYLKMYGDNMVEPNGAVPELLERAVEQGTVTAAEVAAVLDTEELPVEYTEEWEHGREG